MVTFSDAEVSRDIVYHIKKILILMEDNNNEYLDCLLKHNQRIVDSYNLQYLTVLDITPTEIGCFNSTIKKVAVGYYKYLPENISIDTDNSLLYSYTIFMRKVKSKRTWKRTSLELATTNIFKTEIINQLIKIN